MAVPDNTPAAKVNGAHSEHPDRQPNGEVALKGKDRHELVLATFRCLIGDLCQQFNMGHPGSAMGMAAIGVALWAHVMRYSPHNPTWFNRDRFVLSNGHACLFQYTFLHLTGYKAMTWEQLKSYHSDDPGSLCPGHPEIEIDGIEVTTGPLGQGIANAVGFAMAERHLAAQYNRPGHEVVDNMTYCTIGDACLQEGVGLEAISLAGHFRLRKLVVIYDNNQISCDGSIDLCNTEDINSKMRACGWDVIDVFDGNHDISAIAEALTQAKNKLEDRPTLINVRTTIGFGAQNQGQAITHGAPLGADNLKHVKKTFGMDPEQKFIVGPEVREFFSGLPARGKEFEDAYNRKLDAYEKAYPELAAEFKKRREGQILGNSMDFVPPKSDFPKEDFASRKSAGLVFNPIAENVKSFMVGTADLSPSVNMAWKTKTDFQHPALRTTSGPNGNYSGRYLHWGIREHAMCSISNGIAAYNPGTIIPVTSSFFMFYIYAAPGVRMGALQHLQTIHIATHDSIGTGEDGPTHQPIELAAMYRAMPNLVYIRPADTEEVVGAFDLAISLKHNPSMISVSRQTIPQYPEYSRREGVFKGAYVFIEDAEARVTLIGVGAEMQFAVGARKILAEKFDIKARVVSMPCQRLFDAQDISYRREVLKRSKLPTVVIEAYASNGWERWADAGYGMSTYGHSLPGKPAYKHFGFDSENIAPKIRNFVQEAEKNGLDSLRDVGFRELNSDNHTKGLKFHEEVRRG